MPDVSYNPALNPLEVRVKCSGSASHCESWHVVIASSLQPEVPSTERASKSFFQQKSCGAESTQLSSGTDSHFDQAAAPYFVSGCDDRDQESYNWINRPSDASSLCLDDLTDIDILSQISAYYG
uniref:Uncharacterized protein n=1 Tax=Globisporangium ultimum (strain ATCC 200006 / CBS 805.95 / DAOM BR144) TaxID=431595 RepID=K3WU10_GLOUD